MMNKTILVTGGSGYIGSHTVLLLLEDGYDVVVLDNLSNSSEESLNRVEQLTGRRVSFYPFDIKDKEGLDCIFSKHQIDGVIHFAGLKSVKASVDDPLSYYDNNISGTISLLEVMRNHNVKTMVFSSSATVYGDKAPIPYQETAHTNAVNPYGRTKLCVEHLLRDMHASDPYWSISLLRYFNPVGAHPSGLIGEDPLGIPDNLMPYITQVAVGKRKQLNVFGGDYSTKDGTCIRDYIHVMDLAAGHLKALRKLFRGPTLDTYNLGSGLGTSVLELLKTFEDAANVKIPYRVVERREGDLQTFYADSTKAQDELSWTTEKGLMDMCRDAWNWQHHNPQGYRAS